MVSFQSVEGLMRQALSPDGGEVTSASSTTRSRQGAAQDPIVDYGRLRLAERRTLERHAPAGAAHLRLRAHDLVPEIAALEIARDDIGHLGDLRSIVKEHVVRDVLEDTRRVVRDEVAPLAGL